MCTEVAAITDEDYIRLYDWELLVRPSYRTIRLWTAPSFIIFEG